MKKYTGVHYNNSMSYETLPDPILVKNKKGLSALVETLARQTLVGIDTEANSLYAYRERVCLIQFSIPGKDYVVDPLTLDDLSSLDVIFDNPGIEKIFHAAEYDILLMKKDFGFGFNNIFDTMVAARILGWKSVGLSSILESQFGVNVNKKYQRANWGRRPLSKEMLAYAQLDTHYLIPLRNYLKSELLSRKRWELAEEDFCRGSLVEANGSSSKPKDCWQINGVQDLTQQQVAILDELCKYREQVAENLDRPLFKVISDKSLLNIAADMPDSVAELEQIQGISRKQAQWIGKGLISAVRRGMNKQPPKQPQNRRPDERYLDRVKDLRQWRKMKARYLGVESDIILPRDLLFILAKENPQNQEEFRRILQSVPWRLEKFGNELFNLLKQVEA
jgi:ribonuclease D